MKSTLPTAPQSTCPPLSEWVVPFVVLLIFTGAASFLGLSRAWPLLLVALWPLGCLLTGWICETREEAMPSGRFDLLESRNPCPASQQPSAELNRLREGNAKLHEELNGMRIRLDRQIKADSGK